MQIKPRLVRIDAATICQLRCPSCPTAGGEIAKFVKSGLLKFVDFKTFIDKNPWIEEIELTNWGEIFLNTELLQIIRYSHEKDVKLTARNGTNLNNVSEEVLEALVKYKFGPLCVSIDGATAQTYALYRVNGNLDTVLANVRKINELKKKYNSPYPELIWQFVIFGHNEHEIEQAREMATGLGMQFIAKLNWEDLYDRPFSPVKDRELVRATVGVADRTEYIEKFEKHFCSTVCQELWISPQVNFDGEVLGCPVNHWSSFGNAFREELVDVLNNDKLNHARLMVQGLAEERDDVACSSCKIYQQMKEHKAWITAPAPQRGTRVPAKKADPNEIARQALLNVRGFSSL